ncbi:hypothetical protein OJ252_2933 [Cryptosporidium canis]|uniref:Fcf2 pre-rRNA processing C-terminal domain-containing protein n=1 Tax=Cryptosporidium canis TaxID=195482 RepID=A0ABQ8P631_9CRYT|nr:hypothetical protein OJ252_2933 [Cryptosporidium canis]
MNKRYREAEFSSLTLPLGASDIYLSSLDDREFDTQKPSGNIELKKHEMIYNERGVVPGYSVGSDLACDFTNGIQSGKNMRSSNKSTSGWFGFSEREMTEQDRYELMALQLRNSTAPGKFYKNEQLFKKHHSKFNFGIVVDQNRAKTGLSDDSSTRRSNRSKSEIQKHKSGPIKSI